MPRALIIVDYQNDFIPPDGALAVREGDLIVDRINELARSGGFDLVVATRDWHPPDHESFVEQGGPWPVHCVAGTHGAQLSSELATETIDSIVDAGRSPSSPGYSGFEDTNLEQLLRDGGIEELTFVGLATDYCVKHTALDALAKGFTATVETAAVRAVEVEQGDSERALEELLAAGAKLV